MASFIGTMEYSGQRQYATNVSGNTFGLNGPLSMWSVNSGVIVLNTGINYPGIALSFTVDPRFGQATASTTDNSYG